MTVEECLLTRRSTRAFEDREVDASLLDEIVKAGSYAPSAMNEQPWQFTVVTNAQKLAALNGAIKKYMGTCADELPRRRSSDPDYCCYYGAPALIIVSCPDVLYPAQDASCALQNMFLRAHSLSLGSCWINQLCGAACDDKNVRPLLDSFGIPKDHKVYGCAAIGYIRRETELKPRRATVKYVV